ncbi:MAG: hypothetical protein U0990_01160 [Candidatus Nanopelagicales bacterium]|nr:hypothetical protein [Candidatus Nanopelagicales bacterium]MDZ4248685.1 hypothetical protein [Candidatus Nanopelagicales bacterium]
MLNKADFEEEMLTECGRFPGEEISVIRIDLNGSESGPLPEWVNVTPTAVAEAVLVLQRQVRTKDTIGRIGDHELAVLIADLPSRDKLTSATKRIRAALSEWAAVGPAGVPTDALVWLTSAGPGERQPHSGVI